MLMSVCGCVGSGQQGKRGKLEADIQDMSTWIVCTVEGLGWDKAVCFRLLCSYTLSVVNGTLCS